jgi:hypothetical protein
MRCRMLLLSLSVLLVSACVYPMSRVEQGANGGSLFFPRVEAGVRVFVDGADMGEATAYDGQRNVLGVSAGGHRVSLRQGGTTLYDRQIYVGADARLAIEVP